MLSVRRHFVPTMQKNGVEIREHHIYLQSSKRQYQRVLIKTKNFLSPYLQELIGPAYHLQTPLNILQEGSI